MRWISASQLETWGQSSLGSRVELAKIVSDLIRATARDLTAIRFPSGDKGQVRGFDGHLESSTEALNVPMGLSFWEFGVERDYKTKAKDDFDTRTTQVTPDEQRNTTLVLVSPWTWDSSKSDGKVEDWVTARKKESAWNDVRYIDGAGLENWLDHCPGAAAWHAKRTLKVSPPDGIHSTDEFWADFAGRFGPAITEEVLLCERDTHKREVLASLTQTSSMLTLVGDSPDEVVAFTVAAIRKAEPQVRLFLEARTLVVDSVAAARQLTSEGRLVLLLRNDAARSPAQFSDRGPLLVPLGRTQRGSTAAVLNRPTGYAMAKAMMSMGFTETRALTLARGCGRSLTALARLIPSGSSEPPAWEGHASNLLPAILAGAWDSTNPQDTRALEQLAGGLAYDEIERRARTFLDVTDPPFDLEGTVWKVRAPMDAFMRIGPLIGSGEAKALFASMSNVFSVVEPDVKPDDLVGSYRASVSGHSEWIRQGLATTLLLLAAWDEPARVSLPGETGQIFANRLLQNLPGLTTDHRLLNSLKEELPLLAEAAPYPLLSALEQLLEGQGERIRGIFEEQPALGFPVSKHTGVLWALETLAWDPEYFDRAVLILARLAEIDPGGRLGNRPANSLFEIFLLWSPQTNASPDQRLARLAEIAERYPQIGWKLIVRLLPTHHGVSTPTAKPRLREAGAADRKPITYGELGEAQAVILQLAMALAGNEVDRWITLIPGLANFPPDARNSAIALLDHLLATLGERDRKSLWSRLRDEVWRHERFNSAPWAALKGDGLVPLQELVKRYSPTDPVSQLAWLFDSWVLDDTADLEVSNGRRTEVLKQLFAAGGQEGLLKLGTESKMPHLVVEAIANAKIGEESILALLERSFTFDPRSSFTWGLAALYRQVAGPEKALSWLTRIREDEHLSTELTAHLLLAWPDSLSTWQMVRRFGPEVTDSYWKQRPPRYVTGPRKHLLRALLMLLRVGRPSVALESAANRRAEIPSPLLLRLLDNIVLEVNSRARVPDTMLSYHVEETLAALDSRPDVSVADIARREYSLLALLESSKRNLRIHELMAQDANFYHQLLREVFRGASEPKREVDDDARGRATLAYSLLSDFKRIPGLTQMGLDAETLAHWVDAVRGLGVSTDRAEITDEFVGKTLAHAPEDSDGGWPHRVVRDQIERLESEAVERGILMERTTMRGAHWRGLYDGGGLERILASAYRHSAEVARRWRRTSNMLSAIAMDWDARAALFDTEAAQRKLTS